MSSIGTIEDKRSLAVNDAAEGTTDNGVGVVDNDALAVPRLAGRDPALGFDVEGG